MEFPDFMGFFLVLRGFSYLRASIILSPGCHNGPIFWKLVLKWNIVSSFPAMVTNFLTIQ